MYYVLCTMYYVIGYLILDDIVDGIRVNGSYEPDEVVFDTICLSKLASAPT